MKEREQPLLQESSAFSSRREMMHLTAVSLCFATLFFPATAEARPGNATMKEQVMGKLDELKDKAGLSKPKLEELKGKAGELKEKAGLSKPKLEELKEKAGLSKPKDEDKGYYEPKDTEAKKSKTPGGASEQAKPPQKEPSVPLVPLS